MRVRKRLQLNAAVSTTAALVVAIILFVGLYRVHRAFEELDIADEILNGLFQRDTLRFDYLITGSERAREQWFAGHAQISSALKTAAEKFEDTEDKKTIDELIRHNGATAELFTAIVENREKSRSGEVPAELSQTIENRLLTQVNIRLYGKVLNIRTLRDAARSRVFSELKRTGGGIAVVISLVAALAAISSWTMGRSIGSRIGRLREGSSIIGEGNLRHRIDMKGNDEFAELSRAFDAMTAKLSISYLELQNENTERRRAEDALRGSERSLRTARDELEKRVRERTIELERRNLELQNFTFVAAHDLQEPLRKIQTFGDLVADKCRDSVGQQELDYIRRMRQTAARMQQVLHSLLEYSRLTSNVKPFTRVDLGEIARDAVSDFELQIRDTGASVEIGSLPDIDADFDQMVQLFQNLLANALRFRRQGARAMVKIYAECNTGGGSGNGECKIYVEDNGIGFDEKYLDKIFAPFQRLHSKDEYDGIGMGLAICSKIVERHKGSITAKSTPGKGSTFVVTLPVNQVKS